MSIDVPERVPTGDVGTPIDVFLSAQADLSAVERFARTYDSDRTGQWSTLIPLTHPQPGQHYRFEVDLDTCTGCKACVSACHSLNGLDHGESFRSVGQLVSEIPIDLAGTLNGSVQLELAQPINQTVTTACHHCAEPGCLTGCPAKAYEKDPVTGIVKHLDDACIGCEYCTLMCPYDVPVYNDRLGIVRKCDMCTDRLADNEAPACVQGCPNNAIKIGIGSPEELDEASTNARLLPGAAPSAITTPTTCYHRSGQVVQTELAGAVSADANQISPGHGHFPLVLLLVLSQVAVGLHISSLIAAPWLTGAQATASAACVVALTAGAAACSVLHLGQPLKAWRAVLGFRHSWLSREVLAIGTFACLSVMYLGVVVVTSDTDGGSAAIARSAIGLASAVAGVAVVVCSAMVYAATQRTWWRASITGPKFVLTAAAGGTATLLALGALVGEKLPAGLQISLGVAYLMAVGQKLTIEQAVVRSPIDEQEERTRTLFHTHLAADQRRRTRTAIAATCLVLVSVAISVIASGAVLVSVGLLFAAALTIVAELLARSQFFRASSAISMPGAPV